MRTFSALFFLSILSVENVFASAVEWSGLNPSTATLSRAGTGVTHPIAMSLPVWSRKNAADSAFLNGNPAFLSTLGERRGKITPLALQSSGAGSEFDYTDAIKNRHNDSASLASALSKNPNSHERSKVLASSQWLTSDMGLDLYISQDRTANLSHDGSLDYRHYREAGIQLGAGGIVFNEPGAGRFELGINFKVLYRSGDEKQLTPAQVATGVSLRDADSQKDAAAFGADYGFLYTVDPELSGDWRLQAGFVWRDVGTTQFAIGDRTSRGDRMSFLPNNHIIGVGIGLPKFRDGFRSALRIEYGEWTRKVSAADKFAMSYELRLPVWAALSLGYKAKSISGGFSFRFPGFEVELASVSELLNEGSKAYKSRAFLMELRGAF